MALKKYIQPNSPCDLFAIRFVLFAPFLLPTASVADAAANYCPLEKLAKQKGLVVHLCICAPTIVHTVPSPVAGILPRTPGKLHPVRTSFHLSATCRASRRLTHSSLRTSELTQLLFHHYMAQKCSSSPVFEKPFHFSLLRGSCQ